MDSITIRIMESSEGGYVFDIYENDAIDELATPDDRGLCTTTMLNALDMAMEQVKSVIKREKGEECEGCNIDMNATGMRSSFFTGGNICPTCYEREEVEGDFIGER